MTDPHERAAAFQHMLFYEIIPPAREKADRQREAYLRLLEDAARRLPLDAINIPEVHQETDRRHDRTVTFIPKEEPRIFGRAVTQALALPVIINRVVVHQEPSAQWRWFEETASEYGIRRIVVVGGATSDVEYPGPSVTQAARYLSKHQAGQRLGIRPGGITIPSRRHEAQRLLNKARAGIQYFTSQVLYDAAPTKALLQDYSRACEREGVAPRPIFLSFAPVSRAKDLAFLRWLGVEIAPEIRRRLSEAASMAAVSLDLEERLLAEILEHAARQNLAVPLGVNVAHIMSYNRRLAVDLGERLAALLARSGSVGGAARAQS